MGKIGKNSRVAFEMQSTCEATVALSPGSLKIGE